jgi:hypothetical protein
VSVTASPLAATEESFIRLTRTHLLVRGHSVHPWLQDRPYGLDELREILMTRGTPYAVRDQVWRHTIAAARRSKDWILGALGLSMPMLRSAVRMARRGLDVRDRIVARGSRSITRSPGSPRPGPSADKLEKTGRPRFCA